MLFSKRLKAQGLGLKVYGFRVSGLLGFSVEFDFSHFRIQYAGLEVYRSTFETESPEIRA